MLICLAVEQPECQKEVRQVELTERQKIIFKTIVEQFTVLAEPIGSKSLLQNLDFQVSSATVRNEMAALEKYGLLEKTYVSSGRIPSQKGYRYYVENLMELNLDPAMEDSLRQLFSRRHFTLEEVISASCSILSDMTNLTSVVLGPKEEASQKLLHLQLLPVSSTQAVAVIVTDQAHTEHRVFNFETDVSVEDLQVCTRFLNEKLTGTPISEIPERLEEIRPLMQSTMSRYEVLFEAFAAGFMRMEAKNSAVYGRANMLCQPEFTDIKKVEHLMRMMEEPSLFKAWTEQGKDSEIFIDSRNSLIQIGDCSVLSTRFRCSDSETAQLMVVGPSRMNYSRVISLMDTISDVIEDACEVHSEGGLKDQNERK